ncbi:MAG TPA: hypothetical protein VGN42_04045 [Pirellulales bacterium]|jgi:hypothetical protein|nr:hypothetical protein [Pirellulales bacterium]
MLLMNGLVEGFTVAAGLKSRAGGQKRLETPHFAVRYQALRESLFWQS